MRNYRRVWSVQTGLFSYDCESDGLDGSVESVTGCIHFCVDMIIPCKTIKVFSNNKPWVTKEIKGAINEKKAAFRSRDRERMREAQKNLKQAIRLGKKNYKDKAKKKLQDCDSRGLWKGLKSNRLWPCM